MTDYIERIKELNAKRTQTNLYYSKLGLGAIMCDGEVMFKGVGTNLSMLPELFVESPRLAEEYIKLHEENKELKESLEVKTLYDKRFTDVWEENQKQKKALELAPTMVGRTRGEEGAKELAFYVQQVSDNIKQALEGGIGWKMKKN